MNKTIYTLLLGATVLLGSITGCQKTSHLYLPSKITEYNSYYDKMECEITFEYDKDMLGYTKTKILDLGSITKCVETFRYSKDYTICEYCTYEYVLFDEDYALTDQDKAIFQFLDNGSSIETYYLYDDDTESFMPYVEYGYFCNERGQEIRSYTKYLANSYEPTEFMHSETLYEYDQNGYLVKQTQKSDDDLDGHNLYIDYYEEYSYDENYSTGRADSYYWDGDKFVSDGWTIINITHENGLHKFDEQIYYSDTELGNHNVFHYDDNWFRVYENYGDGREVCKYTLNEFNQIIKYESSDTYFGETQYVLDAEYLDNGGGIKSSSYHSFNEDFDTLENATYTYENNQLVNVYFDTSFKNLDEESEESGYIDLNIEYSNKSSDELLKRLGYIEEIISTYSHYILVDEPFYSR